jgi:hypothetical protein
MGEMELAKGFEPSTQNPQITQSQSVTQAQDSGYTQIRAQMSEPIEPELAKVVGAWSRLSQPLKAAILAIVGSVRGSEENQ